MRLTILGALALSALSGCSTPHRFLAARIAPDNASTVIVVREQQSGPTKLKPFSGSVIETTPSPSGLFLGTLVANIDGSQPTVDLHIIDKTSTTVRSMHQVYAFAFSPDEAYIAVIRGSYFEGEPGFQPTATEILGLQGPDIGIIDGLEQATELQWVQFEDQGLVLIARVMTEKVHVKAYVLDTLTLIPTHYLGIHFSPDGHYYYLTPAETIFDERCHLNPPERTCIQVYARESSIPLQIPVAKGLDRPLGWVDNTGLLIGNNRNHECQIVDVKRAKTRGMAHDVDWSWHTRRGFIVEHPNKPTIRDLSPPKLSPSEP
ncbi:MAG: hypothetical protein KTR25_13170 [Myxococcales bacterium]|nr:hypothetical protein [Myxococcales bacterium]